MERPGNGEMINFLDNDHGIKKKKSGKIRELIK